MLYEVTITKKVEEKIVVRGCGTKSEAMRAAEGAAKGPNVTDICIKNVLLIGEKRSP